MTTASPSGTGADLYGSHPHLRRALQEGVPRDKVTILTKTEATTAMQMKEDLDRFRRELGTDYLDICLPPLPDPTPTGRSGAKARWKVLSEAQGKGIVKAHGVSCHTFGALQTAAKTDWVQVDPRARQPGGSHHGQPPRRRLTAVLRDMKAKGKGIIGMKILGAGQLRNKADECFQWALAQDCVDCFTLGMQNPTELQNTLRQIPAASVRG